MEQTEKRPRLDNYFWAIALIIAGLFFGAESLGILPNIGEATTWSWVFLGAGIAGLVLSAYSLSSSDYENPSTWDWIFGALLFAVGVGGFLGLDIALPVILIVLGLAGLASLLLARK